METESDGRGKFENGCRKVNATIRRLPGVQSFLGRVTVDLDAGSNVILHCPPNAPGELCDAIRDHCADMCPHRAWVAIDASDWRHSTLSSMAHQIASVDTREQGAVVSPAQLADYAADRVYCIENVPARCWSLFLDFLECFRQANHGREESDRDVFLVNASGMASVPIFDIGLRVVAWKEAVKEVDARLFYELSSLGDRRNSEMEASVRTSIAMELGGADLGLAHFLASRSLPELIDPTTVLCDFAETSGWCHSDCNSWNDGGIERYRGRDRVHSAVLAKRKSLSELQKRIWHGQLVVVFPYLEEQRIQLLPRIKPSLRRITLSDREGNPTELEDLELGSLAHFARRSSAPRSLQTTISLLRDIRHELAHLRPLDEKLLQRLLHYAANEEANNALAAQ